MTGSKAIFHVPQCIPTAFLAFCHQPMYHLLEMEETHEVPKHPQRIDGRVVDWRHLISWCVGSDGDQGEIEWSESFTDLFESWTDW